MGDDALMFVVPPLVWQTSWSSNECRNCCYYWTEQGPATPPSGSERSTPG